MPSGRSDSLCYHYYYRRFETGLDVYDLWLLMHPNVSIGFPRAEEGANVEEEETHNELKRKDFS